ncbi:hypothetical protein ACFFGT_02840 [Mucilaginibacter angelicae]|uniref:SMODS and SLOG-associating 2TM effector domain-containing protein n=1 Tax=Mucilaginibacter angelicae TaxID=869718 RepID=A0ABV6L301_9SPHI
MDLQDLFNNLKNSKELIVQYVDRDSKIWGLKFYIQNYNRKKLFNFLSVIGTLLFISLLMSPGPGPKFNVAAVLYIAPLTFVFLRFVIGDGLDWLKRKTLLRKSKPEIFRLTEEMNQLVNQLEEFTVLPPKYRTIHAVDTIGGYILDKRIDSLKEGLNLYEDELFKMQQLKNQNFQIQQNYQMMYQNSQMIEQNKKMIRAQAVTNTLLIFK